MEQASQRSALSGPTLIRVLARLSDIDVPAPGQSLSDRLSQWLGWTDAITLSGVLNASPPAAAGARVGERVGERIGAPAGADDAARLCAQTRSSLAQAIVGVNPSGVGRHGGAHARIRDAVPMVAPDVALDAATADYADFRQRYLSLQQTMQTDVGQLRGRLRRLLAARTPGLAKLALLDASMEQALGARERSLLASIPTLLGAHFERLRDAERQRLADTGDASNTGDAGDASDAPANQTPSTTPGAWLHAFRNDMRSVLLAELDVRFQPVEGLLAALRAS
ncbi:DUF3348 domain-containing protein [Burkholderia guangdongensis]|uniref:DUF3348 domain-containing protein n=1 Tax=Burkholderia guangdongensis TaxID=1792500 RepID=UPI0015CA73BA|nr:DUF3348 domain-containing protein [Burkholderia guangdongensis]